MTSLVVMEGDGIGPEITAATLAVLRRADAVFGLGLTFTPVAIGLKALARDGTTFPNAAFAAAQAADGVVLGPVSHNDYPPFAQGGLNPSGELRKRLDLYANIRPARTRGGFPPRCGVPVDLVIVRENTEGFYADRSMFQGSGEFMPTPDLALAVRKITRQGSTRIAETAFALAMQRQSIDVLVDEQLCDERNAELAARNDLVSDGRTDELAFTRLTRELLAPIATDDDLRRNQLDHLGDVVTDARPLAAARRTCPLRGGHEDRVIDAAQMVRRCRAVRRLPPRPGLDLVEVVVGRLVVDPRCGAQFRVGVVDLVRSALLVGFGFAFTAIQRIDEEHELRFPDLLALLEARRDPREPPRHVGVVGDELAYDREDGIPVIVLTQRTDDVEYRAAELVARRQRVHRRIRRRARLAIHVAHLDLATIARKR